MSVKKLNDIAAHTQALADEAQALATAIRAVVDDCAEQLALKKDNENRSEESTTPAAPSAEPAWVAEAEAEKPPRGVPFRCTCKYRYRQADQEVEALWEEDRLILTAVTPQRAITPGQSAVLYEGERCLGGGIVAEVTDAGCCGMP